MTRYYCSGFDLDNIFGHGLGKMFKAELEDTKSIVYIPAGAEKIEKARAKHIPNFTKHFKNVGIEFESVNIITPELSPAEAKDMIKNANFVMLMGGDPYKQKDLCKSLNILDDLKNYNGVMLGFSAGAMLMSKYIIITPCSDEFPTFQFIHIITHQTRIIRKNLFLVMKCVKSQICYRLPKIMVNSIYYRII